MKLKDSIIQAPILCYANPSKKYIVYTDASDDACRAQLTQQHNGTEFPVTLLSHTFSETQRKWSTTEQEAEQEGESELSMGQGTKQPPITSP